MDLEAILLAQLQTVYTVVQSLSHVWLFATPWTPALQAPLSLIISWTLLKLTSNKSVMLSNHLILWPSLLLLHSIFSASGLFFFPMIQLLTSGHQSIGTSTSASVLPNNIKDWFPLGLTGLNSWQCKGLSRIFPSTTIQKHQFFSTQPFLLSNSYMHRLLLEKPWLLTYGSLLA